MRKIQDYQLGENVYEDDYYAGKVVAIVEHPNKPDVGYLLLINTNEEYTIYRGLYGCRTNLSLTRNIPRSVAVYFAEIILGAESELPQVVRRAKKFPVITKPKVEQETEEPQQMTEELPEPPEPRPTKAPYFDFV